MRPLSIHTGIAALALTCAFAPFTRAASYSNTFDGSVSGSIFDTAGRNTGLSTRLSGTGGSLPTNDSNLNLQTGGTGTLGLTSTNADINGAANLGNAEFLGLNLSTLGFTGGQDFTISAQFNNVQYSQLADQAGIYIGKTAPTGGSTADTFRAGILFFNNDQYLFAAKNTSNHDDINENTNGPVAPDTGNNIVLTLSRTAGTYALNLQNLTDNSKSGTLTFTQPTYLNGESDLNVGLFAGNPANSNPKTQTIEFLNVTVVPEPASFGLMLLGAAIALRRRQPN